MDPKIVRTVLRRQPFSPFTLRLADGRELHVPDRHSMAMPLRQVIVIHPDESSTRLEPSQIVSIDEGTDSLPPLAPPASNGG